LLKSFRVRSITVAEALTRWKTSDLDRGACFHQLTDDTPVRERPTTGSRSSPSRPTVSP
jgi:hypothetical protein